MVATRLVLLPGMDGTGILFEPLLDALPQGWTAQVVRYPPDKPLGYESLLDVVLHAIEGNEPFMLVGESFSGPLALMAALGKPAGLQAVILCAIVHSKPDAMVCASPESTCHCQDDHALNRLLARKSVVGAPCNAAPSVASIACAPTRDA